MIKYYKRYFGAIRTSQSIIRQIKIKIESYMDEKN